MRPHTEQCGFFTAQTRLHFPSARYQGQSSVVLHCESSGRLMVELPHLTDIFWVTAGNGKCISDRRIRLYHGSESLDSNVDRITVCSLLDTQFLNQVFAKLVRVRHES